MQETNKKEAAFYRELGARIASLRERKGLSIKELSDKLGIDEAELSAIEEGTEELLPDKLMELISALGAGIETLLPEYISPASGEKADQEDMELFELLRSAEPERRKELLSRAAELMKQFK